MNPRQPKRSLAEAFQDDLNDVDATAQLAHLGQKRRSGEDYITHPQEVAKLIHTFYPGDDLARHVAMLHDTFEDGPSNGTDEDSLRSMVRGSIQSEEDAENVVDAISYLTHEPGGDYTSYVANLANSNKLALRVKLADMLHNLQSNPTPKQRAKYGDAILNLGGKPKGISPLHWKLLLNAANLNKIQQSGDDAPVNEQHVYDDNYAPSQEELMVLQLDFMNAYQKWVDSGSFERAVRSYVKEYVHNSEVRGDAAPTRQRKYVEEAIKLLWDDPLNVLEDEFTKGEIASLVQNPFAAELYYEGSLPSEAYSKLTHAIRNDMSNKLDYSPKETFSYEAVKRAKKNALKEQEQPPVASPASGGSTQNRLDTWLHDVWQKNHMEEIYSELEAIASFKGSHLTPPEVGQEMFNAFEQNIIDEVPFADVSVGLAQEQQALRDTIVRGLTKVAQRLWASAVQQVQSNNNANQNAPEADPYAYYGVSRDDF